MADQPDRSSERSGDERDRVTRALRVLFCDRTDTDAWIIAGDDGVQLVPDARIACIRSDRR